MSAQRLGTRQLEKATGPTSGMSPSVEQSSMAAVEAHVARNVAKDSTPTPSMERVITKNENSGNGTENGAVNRGSRRKASARSEASRRSRRSRKDSKTRKRDSYSLFDLCFGFCFLRKRERGADVSPDPSIPSSALTDARHLLPLSTVIDGVNAIQVQSWNFDVFLMDKRVKEHSLRDMFLDLLGCFNLFDDLQLDHETCRRYITEVESRYEENPYHNRVHATDVLQSVGVILFLDNYYEHFKKLEILALILSAAVHDVCHPGVNNEYHKKTHSQLAHQYQDSMNERMHIARAYEILLEDESKNMLKGLTGEEGRLMKRYVEEIIIATDMDRHKWLVCAFSKRFSGKNGKAMIDLSLDDRILLLQMIVHCADISNPTRPLFLCRKWSQMITDEMLQQGKREQKEGYKYSPGCDPQKSNLARSQKFFLETFVIPCFKEFGSVVPSFAKMTLANAEVNKKHWDETLAESTPRE